MEVKNKMKEIKPNEAKSLVDRLGPHIDSRYDFTYDPVFPKTREDICAVKRMAENGSSYGFDTIYLLWRADEEINYEHLIDSKSTKNYIHIDTVLEDQDDIVVKIYSGGSYSGSPWRKQYRRSKKRLGLK